MARNLQWKGKKWWLFGKMKRSGKKKVFKEWRKKLNSKRKRVDWGWFNKCMVVVKWEITDGWMRNWRWNNFEWGFFDTIKSNRNVLLSS